MSKPSIAARVLIAAATIGILAAGGSSPAFAKKPAKPLLRASMFATETSRVCMPRDTIDALRASDLPETLCYTRAEWEAKGVAVADK